MDIVISEIEIIPVRPKNGLVAFASCVVDGKIYLGSMAIHTTFKRDSEKMYRLTYPTKKIGEHSISYFQPTTEEVDNAIEKAILDRYEELMV